MKSFSSSGHQKGQIPKRNLTLPWILPRIPTRPVGGVRHTHHDITVQAAAKARALGVEPRVALLSFSNFGSRGEQRTAHLREAVRILKEREVDFEVDGEMAGDTALDKNSLDYYPFIALGGPANVLIMPNLHAANISYRLVEAMDGARVIGPILLGLEKPVQIARLGATVNDLLNMAALAAIDIED